VVDIHPQPLKEIVQEVIRSIKDEEKERIFHLWKDIVPLEAQRHSRLKEVIKEGKKVRLIVAVDSSAWLADLNFRKEIWKEKIENALEKRFSVQVSFRIEKLREEDE